MSTILDPQFWIFVLLMAGLYTIFALGLQVQYGFAGLMNFGHVASMGLAAYGLAILVAKYGWSLWLAMPVAIVIAVVGTAVLGLSAIRLRGDYFAIVTIAFSEIVRYLAIGMQDLTGGSQGTIAIPGPAQGTYTDTWDALIINVQGRLGFLGDLNTRDTAMCLIVWLVAIIVLAITYYLTGSPWGRALKAVREDEPLARALGKPVFALKMQALLIGAALAAVAGILYALQFSIFTPQDFEPLTTFFAWIIVLLGGTARIWAVPVGAVVFGLIFAGTRFFDFPPFSWVDSSDRAYLRLIIIGLLLIGLVLYRPAGLLGRPEEIER